MVLMIHLALLLAMSCGHAADPKAGSVKVSLADPQHGVPRAQTK
jgi:hypothetical protein